MSQNDNVLQANYNFFDVHVCVKNTCFKTYFLLIKNLKQDVIFRNFISYFNKKNSDSDKRIVTNINGVDIYFDFCSKITKTYLQELQSSLKYKQNFLNDLNLEINHYRIENS
jgi:hypothetical protein